jgi:preprotein translocase subunit SecA
MPAPELLEDVRRAYEDGLVDPGFASLEGIERDLRSRPQRRRERHYVITDAIAEMEWWASFHPEDSRSKKLPKLENLPPPPPSAPPTSSYAAPQPFVREPKIGRNDPCPCGSGKKYKKCCGKG